MNLAPVSVEHAHGYDAAASRCRGLRGDDVSRVGEHYTNDIHRAVRKFDSLADRDPVRAALLNAQNSAEVT
jgi:hypothetical protein